MPHADDRRGLALRDADAAYLAAQREGLKGVAAVHKASAAHHQRKLRDAMSELRQVERELASRGMPAAL